MVDAMPGVDLARTGAARRRRERRLRAYLRYARMSVQMALAEASHHTAPRGQRIARAREEEREVLYTAAFRTTVPPPEPELFDLFEEPGGGRPDLLLEPQEAQPGVQRHTVEQTAEVAPMVQILDAPVPQMGIELADILKCVDLQAPVEQVIDVPKIFLDCFQPRSVLRLPQTAEQLVEVPTVISFSSLLQRTDEQIVDIPVPGRGGGGRGGFQGSHPGQSSTAGVAEQIVEISGRGDPQGFLPRQSTLQRTVEQLVDIPVPAGGGLQNFRSGQGSSALSQNAARHGDLRTSALDVRSARFAGSSSARVHPHSSSWTPAAYEVEELSYPDIEYEFFDLRGLSCVRRWMPSWAGFAYWYFVPDRGWYGAFTEAQWGLLRGGLDDDGGGGVARRRQGGRD